MPVDDLAATRERLGFLLARHGQIANTRMRIALATTGLGPRHCYALTQLADNGSMSQQALLEALAVDPSILVAILNDLEREGLAERRRDPADRRRHIVEMSRKGAAVVRRIDRAAAGVEDDMFANLDDDERAQLHGLLARLRVSDAASACTEDVADDPDY